MVVVDKYDVLYCRVSLTLFMVIRDMKLAALAPPLQSYAEVVSAQSNLFEPLDLRYMGERAVARIIINLLGRWHPRLPAGDRRHRWDAAGLHLPELLMTEILQAIFTSITCGLSLFAFLHCGDLSKTFFPVFMPLPLLDCCWNGQEWRSHCIKKLKNACERFWKRLMLFLKRVPLPYQNKIFCGLFRVLIC